MVSVQVVKKTQIDPSVKMLSGITFGTHSAHKSTCLRARDGVGDSPRDGDGCVD